MKNLTYNICDGVPFLGYTTNDDGVHMFCFRCGFDHNMGFNANVENVKNVQYMHDRRLFDKPIRPMPLAQRTKIMLPEKENEH